MTTEPSYVETEDVKGKPSGFDGLTKFLTHNVRDIRLGNLKQMFVDIPHLQDRNDLVTALISDPRGFADLGVIAKSRVVSAIELSQSVDGFFRKNSRTFTSSNIIEDKTPKGGMLSNAFGKNKGA